MPYAMANPVVRPLSAIRKVIAARTSEAARTIPHYRIGVDIDMGALLKARSKLNESSPDVKISINDCLVKLSGMALVRNPECNVQLVDDCIHQFTNADIGVAIALEGGLATPIVHSAEKKPVFQISAEIADLASRARLGKLRRSEIEGGTLGISNLGMSGIDQFDAIINPPQSVMLAIGRIRKLPMVDDQGQVRIGAAMHVTLSADHRTIDGAVAARLLSVFREYVESPDDLLVR